MKKQHKDEEYKSFLGLTPLIVFLVIFMSTGAITKSFTNMPILVGFMFVLAYSLCLNRKGEKLSLDEKIEIFSRGGGESTIILMVVIFILAGAFYSVANAMGSVESTVNLGLSILPTKAILPGVFIIGCIISFAMGTSMGTITALTPIAVGMSQQTGIALPLIVGTVVGGAMFGDNLSFVSDTTIAATRTQGVELKDKFKMNGLIVLPAVIVTLIILACIPIGNASIKVGAYSLLKVLPYVSIIICALIGFNVMVVLAVGILTGSVLGLALGSFNVVQLFGFIQRGFGWMQDLSLIAIVIGGIIELMKYYGGIGFLLDKVTSRVKSKKGAEAGIAALASLIDLATANNTISIVTAGPLAKDISEEYDIDPRRTASILDIFSSAFQGLVPYGGQLLVAAGLAKISPVQLMPYSIYSILMIVFGALSIILGIPRFKRQSN
ncbi:Na+/H+ antiporter NhaC family protein [Clostridium brassicae]|uniref:Na+/H+ antiporter NhaC family protein n=1 Tax=Clostridium brassicae TaxID=2999072 RepID=A0ABT4DAC2_9CLOT|nr:Na+/H+ antiporter NhaC family protein [Clostridium brassicae]MCY6959259.1 Na+/H+ antiporter NhaC family protein [Clostridium brassicae]